MSERLNKATICSVVFLDIPDQPGKPVVSQIRHKELFSRIIDEAIKDVSQEDRLLVDTGSGTALALFGAPEAALFIAMTIRDAIVRHNKVSDDKFSIRAGISMGPVRVEGDSVGLPCIQGEGVNRAAHIMKLAGPNQILVSRAYYDITSGLTEEIAGMFSRFGDGQEVYSVRSPEEEPFVPESVAEHVEAAPLFSRLLNNENLPRYGLWGSAALVAIVILVGGFMLASNISRPDLGVVIADSKPAAPVTDVHAVTAPIPPAAPVTHATAPNLEPVGPEPSITTVAAQPAASLSAATPPAETQATKPQAVKSRPRANTVKPDIQADIPGSEPVADDAEAEPETPMAAPQQEEKKVAAAPPARSGPVVEERQLPSRSRPKTVWDEFRKSFKQGRKEHICTQAEIALNQCK